MKNILEYKGYFAKVEYSAEDRVLYGKIEAINDLVTFESESVNEIEDEFRQAVDDYLIMCEELGQSPDKTYSGTFNVRIRPELHREIARRAAKNDESLNSMVEKALKAYMEDTSSKAVDELRKIYLLLSSNNKSTSYTSSPVHDNRFFNKGVAKNTYA